MKYTWCAVMLIILSGCTKTYDYLNVPDRETIDARIWESDGAIQYLLNEGYWISMPEFPWQNNSATTDISLASDESVYSLTKEWPQKTLGIHKDPFLADNFKYIGIKYQGDNIGDNRYYEISRCNLAIQELPNSKTLDPDKKRGFLGQFHLIRAMVYFQLVKYYGGVPIITKPLTPETIEGVPRSKAKEVFELIIADCDAAIEYLDGAKYNSTTGKLTKAAAAAWKARAMLYFASPLFNPVNDPEHPNDANRWVEANKANKAAYEICKAAGHELVSDYDKIFQLEGASNKEAIITRSYSAVVNKRGNNVEAKSRPPSEGGSPDDCFRPTVNMLNAYSMKDGVPADKSQEAVGSYKYDSNHIWLNRDPRFNATIGYNGGAWVLTGKATRRQW
ncbi:MAG TPA: RagB/SusD family nutrient uptake outer membrane protein, partial [Niastella sp.]